MGDVLESVEVTTGVTTFDTPSEDEEITVYAGIDVGSRTCKGALVDSDERFLAAVVNESGIESEDSAQQTLQELLEHLDIKQHQVAGVVATGYGRGNVEFADKNVTEITCHAKGTHHLFPTVKGLIDIGGQDSKVIKLDDGGNVVDFAMNDKCAAGTGKFLEVMADTLEEPLDELGKLAQNAENSVALSNMCTVFAESEVISQIHQGVPKAEIVAGICDSVVDQITSQAERVNLSSPLAMTGGVAKNNGVVRSLETELETELRIPEQPQTVGALGAALLIAD